MFPQLKKLNNESGIVLFIVLMVAIVIMVFSVGILTQSVNEINYAQQQTDQIISEQLAKGILWNAYSNSDLTTPGQNVGISTTMQGRTYYITLVNLDTTPNAVINYSIIANYDSFQ